MRKIGFLIFAYVVGAVLAAGQENGAFPRADVFLGYSFLRANAAWDIPAFPNNGGLGTGGFNLTNHIGLEAEFGGYHNGNSSIPPNSHYLGPESRWDEISDSTLMATSSLVAFILPAAFRTRSLL